MYIYIYTLHVQEETYSYIFMCVYIYMYVYKQCTLGPPRVCKTAETKPAQEKGFYRGLPITVDPFVRPDHGKSFFLVGVILMGVVAIAMVPMNQRFNQCI